jgi:hypothetical protein
MTLNLNADRNSAAPDAEFTTLNINAGDVDMLSEKKAQLESNIHSGANWFFWIAALSVINSIIILMDGNWSFLAGMGITQLIDAFAFSFAEEATSAARIIAFVLSLTVAGVLVLFGLQAREKRNWAFITGMVLYALDGLIFFYVQDWLSIAFHLFALYGIFQGLRASNQFHALCANPAAGEAL